MTRKILLSLIALLCAAVVPAQNRRLAGVVIAPDGRPVAGAVVTVEGTQIRTMTDANGNFSIAEVGPDAKIHVAMVGYEPQPVTVGGKDKAGKVTVTLTPVKDESLAAEIQSELDDAIFAEYDTDSASDAQSSPSSLSASRDLFNNIASYKFSEMRFNVRGYDSPYTDIYLNGIKFNDALTGYGPWSLWSGLNDATRNQENVAGLTATEYGLGGVGGVSNINARASQMRKGFRASVVNSSQLYRFRVMLSYASGQLDNGWSYGFSVSTRQGSNGYVDGVYYNGWGYFASVEKAFGCNDHQRLALTVLGAPTQRGAQQASTEEAYTLFGDHYYNPNVGYQDGKLRNARVREMHEPIVMLNYYNDLSKRTRLSAAASFRFGQNGYSALTWRDGADPRPDYYRALPSYYYDRAAQCIDGESPEALRAEGDRIANLWTGMMDWDKFYRVNSMGETDSFVDEGQHRSNYIVEERHTDQRDFNFAATMIHDLKGGSKFTYGIKARINRTEYYDEVKDLLGGDYWLDVDKFAQRDMGSDVWAYQNDVKYYVENGHARAAKEGDKISYDYYANVRNGQLWALYNGNWGRFSMALGGEVGLSSVWRTGLLCKGLFLNNSLGDSKKFNSLTYRGKINLSYRFSAVHDIHAAATFMQNAPYFQAIFVSPRTRNQHTPGVDEEQVYGAELTYNFNKPWLKARLTGYFTQFKDQTDVISFYDDTQYSFTNFAMSGIDKRHIGLEAAVQIPIWGALSLQGAVSYGEYFYTSNPNFIQLADNSAEVKLTDKVYWKNYRVESTPQLAANVGLNLKGLKNWYASVDMNIYDHMYLSMNPMYRTRAAIDSYMTTTPAPGTEFEVLSQIPAIRAQERFDVAYVLNASISKSWYIHGRYQLGFSLEVKNILNNQDIRTGGYEQMRMRRNRIADSGTEDRGKARYSRFDSKYFYMLGTNYYLNLYFRF